MMSDSIISRMVDRFLGWKLPKDFYPDAGISFDRKYGDKWGMPTGTNLLHAEQAKEMIEYLVGDDLDQLQAENERLNKSPTMEAVRQAIETKALEENEKLFNQLTAMQLYAKGFKDQNSFCWLIERNSMWGVEWFKGGGWTRNANEAIKFPSEESATDAHRLYWPDYKHVAFPVVMEGGGEWEYIHTITEHGFINSTPPDLSAVEKLVKDAERYRAFRAAMCGDSRKFERTVAANLPAGDVDLTPEQMDIAIDAAIAEGAK